MSVLPTNKQIQTSHQIEKRKNPVDNLELKSKTNKKKKPSPDELITQTVGTDRNNHALEGGAIERLDPEKIDWAPVGLSQKI